MNADLIKKIIDEISVYGGDYLQIHFSDSENYAIESKVLGNIDNQHLTKEDVKSILKYANDRNIMVIPDFDVPSHSRYWLNLVKNKYGDETYNKVVSDFDDNLVDYFNNEFAVSFIKTIIDEITEMFYQDKFKDKLVYSLGADEVPGTNNFQKDYIGFVNKIASYVTEKGYKPRMWNDSISIDGIDMLNKNIEVVYWQEGFLPVTTFFEKNIPIHNSNFYLLTFSPSKDSNSTSSINEQVNFLKAKYALNSFKHKDNPYDIITPYESLKGTAYTFWNERGIELTDEQILWQIRDLTRSYLNLI
ncbi:family 20 glycosylhydrolase [Mammaliicoccus sciuri]|nr:family 20 glycosylhydrolase [Mammaliicoccus sciuri]